MKNKILPLFIILLICIILITLPYYSTHMRNLELAKTMNISLKEYPHLPSDYFYAHLKTSMSIEEVHKIIIGYEKVFHSTSDNLAYMELYYYPGNQPDTIIPYYVMYNAKDYTLMKVFSEEGVSVENLKDSGWNEGLLTRDSPIYP